MAQFDAYVNPSVPRREEFPYAVALQSDRLDRFTTRLAMPLAPFAVPPASTPRWRAGSVAVAGEPLQLATHSSAPLPARLLHGSVESLEHEAAVLLDALNAVASSV